jgi:hypothetical protein
MFPGATIPRDELARGANPALLFICACTFAVENATIPAATLLRRINLFIFMGVPIASRDSDPAPLKCCEAKSNNGVAFSTRAFGLSRAKLAKE